MRKGLLTLVLALTVVLQTAWAYDFSATSPSGHTLYYEIIGTTNVGVVRPGTDSIYNNYVSGSVVIPDTVAYNGTTYNVTELRPILDSSSNSYYGSFETCGSFESCSGLTSVTIPNSIAVIGDWAFGGCSSLTSITIPDSVTYIGMGAFYDCTGLTSINIPNNVDAIHDCTFHNCTGLTSVTIPNSVTSIGDRIWNLYPGAFDGCTGLTSITIPNSVTSIGYYAFSGCSGLTSITIPNSVTSIGESAFSACSGLTSVTIPNSVDTIHNGTFYNCTSLTSITIPNSVAAIGTGAFSYCSGLTSITIPNNVTEIGQESFAYCSGLTSVTIGNSVRFIRYGAFAGCNNLYEVISLSVNPPLLYRGFSELHNGFSDTVAIPILKVPCGSADAYSSSQWSQYFVDIEEICDDVTITATSANESMGTVLGSGEYEFGTEVTITAIPNEGYRFVSWNDGNTNNPRTITVTEDATYIAIFEEGEEVIRYTITVLSANESMGTVSGGGEYEVGTEITITATPNEGYHFVTWNDGNTDNPRTITVTEDATYIATFEEGVGIESRDMLSELAFYPNPTSGIITFNRNDIMKVEVLDAMGKMVAVYENAFTIDISKLAKGYYAMRITTAEGVAVRKVIRK